MSQERNTPLPTRRVVLVGSIVDALSKMVIEELGAVERYCSNYHHTYQKPGKNYIITEITIEPWKKLISE